MAGEDINYLAKKYCALCFEPLDDDFCGVCQTCGQKTTALNLIKRLRFDNSLDKKSRTTPKFAALISTLAFVVQLAYSVIMLLFALDVLSSCKSTPVSHEPLVSLTEEEQREQEILNFYFDKAMKCYEFDEFLEECQPLEYGMKYYINIWNRAGINKNIEKRQSKIPTDPLPAAKKDTNALDVIEISFLSIYILLSLCGLVVCAAVFFEMDKSVEYLMWCSGEFGKLFILSLNFFSVALLIFSMYHLAFFNERLGGGRLSYSRLWKIHKAKNPIGNADEWCCKYCGYINSKLDSECKSCGKYK